MIKLMSDKNLQKAISAVSAPNHWPSYANRDENGQGTGSDNKPIFDDAGYCWHDYHTELLARRPKQPECVFPEDLDRKNQAFDDWYDESRGGTVTTDAKAAAARENGKRIYIVDDEIESEMSENQVLDARYFGHKVVLK